MLQLFFLQRKKMQGKVDSSNDHEQHRNGLNERAVEVGNAGIVGGKPANGHGAEAVRNRVEQTHTRCPVRKHAGNRQ